MVQLGLGNDRARVLGMSKAPGMVRNSTAILLDFDGPVFSVFSGYPAPVIADQMRDMLMANGHVREDSISDTNDPLGLLRWTAENEPALVTQADDFLCATERRAVLSAAPTVHAHDVIVAASHAGRLVAIVSNNSEDAIKTYLGTYQLKPYVSWVTGRPYAAPHRMKPSPEGILRTTEALDIPPASCVFVGDSVTDLEASRLAGVNFIGYAKCPDKIPTLVNAGAEVVVESMRVIADALEEP